MLLTRMSESILRFVVRFRGELGFDSIVIESKLVEMSVITIVNGFCGIG